MTRDLESRVWAALKGVRFPGMSRDVVSFGFVESVTTEADRVAISMKMTSHNPGAGEQVRQEVERQVAAMDGVGEVKVDMEVVPPRQPGPAQAPPSQGPDLIPDVAAVVAVASGKGGVGKSTVATNLAIRLGQLGFEVGLLDADIYGPSVPTMFGINDKPRVLDNRLQPFKQFGIKVMSLGFIVDMDTPVIWRGPMVMKAIEQMLGDVDWGKLDFLIVDLPPGTGDAQLTLTQRVPLSGAVIVSTPQDVALIDARKGLAMFEKVNVPVIGIVENMSSFVCPHCGESTDVFKRGGGERTAEELGCAFLGRIPLDPVIVEGGDNGEPIVVAQSEGAYVEAFGRIAERVVQEAAALAERRPKMSII